MEGPDGLGRWAPGLVLLRRRRGGDLQPRCRRGRRARRAARPAGHGIRPARGRAAGHRALRDARAACRVLPAGPVADPRPGTRLGGLSARRRGDHSAGGGGRRVGADRARRPARDPRRLDHARGRAGALRLRDRTAVDARAARLPDGHRRDRHRRAAPEALRVLSRRGELAAGGARLRRRDSTRPTRPRSRSASRRSR